MSMRLDNKSIPEDVEVSDELMNKLYKEGKVLYSDLGMLDAAVPNEWLVLVCGNKRAPCRVVFDGDVSVKLIPRNIEAADIRPIKGNEEQLMLMDALLDSNVPVVVVTGRAGTGKTLCTLAAALDRLAEQVYSKIILTKPMVQVGNNEFGILPGEVNDKFLPYLGNYIDNIQQITGNEERVNLDELGMDLVPLQFIRGVSWVNRFVIADEVQTLTRGEVLTLGTRVGKGTKLVLLGDLNQRDTNIRVEDTGLSNLINSSHFIESPLTASIHLKKVERSKVTELFTKVFEGDA